MVILRREFFELTNNIPATVILSELWYWHTQFKKSGKQPYILTNTTILNERVFGMFSIKTIRRALQLLESLGIIVIKRTGAYTIRIEIQEENMAVTKIKILSENQMQVSEEKEQNTLDNLSTETGQFVQETGQSGQTDWTRDWTNCPQRLDNLDNQTGQDDQTNIKKKKKKENKRRKRREGELLRNSHAMKQKHKNLMTYSNSNSNSIINSNSITNTNNITDNNSITDSNNNSFINTHSITNSISYNNNSIIDSNGITDSIIYNNSNTDIIVDEDSNTHSINYRLSYTKMYKLYVILASERGIYSAQTPSNKEIGMLKGLKKYLDEYNVSYYDYLNFCFENWEGICKEVVWDSGRSKLGEKVTIPDICYSKVDILSMFLNKKIEKKPLKKLTDDGIVYLID